MTSIPRCEHPRPDRKRDAWVNLNGVWDFEIDNAKVGLEKRFFERSSLDMKINVPFTAEAKLSGIGHTDFMYAVWYRRDINVPTEWKGKRVILHIDACDHTTTVFVNGKAVMTGPCFIFKVSSGEHRLRDFCPAVCIHKLSIDVCLKPAYAIFCTRARCGKENVYLFIGLKHRRALVYVVNHLFPVIFGL